MVNISEQYIHLNPVLAYNLLLSTRGHVPRATDTWAAVAAAAAAAAATVAAVNCNNGSGYLDLPPPFKRWHPGMRPWLFPISYATVLYTTSSPK